MSTGKATGGNPIAPNSNSQNEAIQIQGTTSASTPSKVTFKDVIEKINSGSQQVSLYHSLLKRVDELSLFRKGHNGEALTLTIANQDTEIQFHNLEMILGFLDLAIDKGKLSKDKFEVELMNMFA